MFALYVEVPRFCSITDAHLGTKIVRRNMNAYENFALVLHMAERITEGTSGEWEGLVFHIPSGRWIRDLHVFIPDYVRTPTPVVVDDCPF